MSEAALAANVRDFDTGVSPRDTRAANAEGRGLGMAACRKIFEEADYRDCDGPSRIYGTGN